MHHQPVMTLDPARIGLVIMDAMPVERERRIAEQKRAVETTCLAAVLVHPRHRRHRALRGGVRILAVHQPLPVGETQHPLLPELVPQGDEGQRPRAPRLALGAFQDRHPLGADPGPQGPREFHPSPGPHPARQPHVRNDPARLRMPVPAQSLGRLHIPEIELVKEGGQRIALAHAALPAKGRLARRRARGVQHIALTKLLWHAILHGAS